MNRPWFKVYAADLITDKKLRECPLEAQAVIFRMWCAAHLNGDCSLPNDAEEIACQTQCKLQCVVDCESYWRQFFETREGRIYSRRMEDEKRRSDANKIGAEARWNKESYADRSAKRHPSRNAKRNAQSQDQSQSNTPNPLDGTPDLKPSEVAQKFLTEFQLSGHNLRRQVEEAVMLRMSLVKVDAPTAMDQIIEEFQAVIDAKPDEKKWASRWLSQCSAEIKPAGSKPVQSVVEPLNPADLDWCRRALLDPSGDPDEVRRQLRVIVPQMKALRDQGKCLEDIQDALGLGKTAPKVAHVN
jgi:uncharacterized protein YdaU (DUF1376 family)